MKRIGLGALALALTLAAAPAGADTPPNVWEIARDPAARDRWELHVAVRELITLESSQDLRALGSAALERARALLEDAEAAKSPDVRLRFDLGIVYEHLKEHERAIPVLKSALSLAPDHPCATEALVELAYAYAFLDRPQEERQAYIQYLARETDDRLRATALLNLAEVQMRLGHLEDAIAGYREAISASAVLPSSMGTKGAILSVWGLAVALDRAGDPAGASEQARRATQMDPGETIIGRDPGVFFVPKYERLWYLALGRTEDAKQAPSAHDAARRWAEVESFWRSYVGEADPKERWLPLARAHLERAHTARLAADKKAARERAPSRPGDDSFVEP